LVAEDDPLIARFLVSNLEGSGFQVTLVEDGDAALEALARERFGLAVLDINMPKTDGYGVLSQMRLRPESRSTPVLMLSSRVQEHDIVRAFDLGADDYVTKPFNPLELVSRIRRLMRRH
jgi:DNA-binding response OmpR family regulator